MPAKFDKMVSDIKISLKKQHPEWKSDKISSVAYATAVSNWKKTHGGKSPFGESVKDWRIVEFFVPIQESRIENDDFMITGVAINETTTLNNVKYVAEELEKAAPTFRNVPILLDHRNEVKNIVGRTTENVNFSHANKRIEFEGKIMDKDIREMIRDGRIGSVSIGAQVQDLVEEEDGSMKAIGVRGMEISLVAVPGDNQATLAQALHECYRLKTKFNMEEKMAEDEVATETEEVVEEEKEEEKVEDKAEETKEEVKQEKATNVTVNIANQEVSEMKKQIAELKELLVVKKDLNDKAKVDETKGIVTKEIQEDINKINGLIVEKSKAGYAMFRDYSMEDLDTTKLKRLVR